MSRPSSFSVEVGDKICALLMEGQSLRSICAAEDMPDRKTVLRWLAADEAFATKYAHARVIQADTLEEDMADIEDRTLSGEIEPAAARVVLGSKQWRASKMAPKKYGDKLDLNHSGRIAVAREMSDDELARIAAGGGG